MTEAQRRTWVACLALLLHAGAPQCADAPEREVARFGGEAVPCGEEAERCAVDFLRRIRALAVREFIVREGLQATPDEIESVRSYDRAFRAHDRRQRALKIAELDERLANSALSAADRSRLEAFRATLVRLARYEADVDAGLEPAPEPPDTNRISGWIERSKLEAALHTRYGGSLGITPAGPYAHGARTALVEAYLRARGISFSDDDFEGAMRRLLAAPPLHPLPDSRPDFTPFWLRPIPASYVAD